MLELSLELLRVVEDAAVASARTMGMGDAHTSDQAAVESMRRCLDTIPIDGTIVIGEGERDSAPMLFIGSRDDVNPLCAIAIRPVPRRNSTVAAPPSAILAAHGASAMYRATANRSRAGTAEHSRASRRYSWRSQEK